MPSYRLTNLALKDLADIWNYTFDHWSAEQADEYYSELVDTFERISDNPGIGKSYDGVVNDLFGLSINRHIVFFRMLNDESIEITRILHEKMDLQNRL